MSGPATPTCILPFLSATDAWRSAPTAFCLPSAGRAGGDRPPHYCSLYYEGGRLHSPYKTFHGRYFAPVTPPAWQVP